MATILIADDLPHLRQVCLNLLAEYDLEIIEAADGHEAITLYRQFRPDGVLLDINMPVLNGLAALDAIRELNPAARVAMLTGLGEEQAVLRAIRAGACDFVLKPFTSTRLTQAVCTLLGRSTLDSRGAGDLPSSDDDDDSYEAQLGICGAGRPLPDRPRLDQPSPAQPLLRGPAHQQRPNGRRCTCRHCLSEG